MRYQEPKLSAYVAARGNKLVTNNVIFTYGAAGSWVRRRRDGTSPQFGTAKQKAAARSMRSAYRSWL